TLATAVRVTEAESLYEIGCGSGPNLRLLREALRNLTLGGCDVRQEYVDFAYAHGLNVDCHALPYEVPAEWDATLSCYAMAYLDPTEVREQLGSIKSRSLIFMEPEGFVSKQPVATQKREGYISCPKYF